MDVSHYARFLRPGHAVTHDRHRTGKEKRAAVGRDYAHAIVDDHSRLAAADAAEHVDIVTFNHDLLVENVLAEMGSAKGRWCLRHGYGHFADRRQFTASGSQTFTDPKTCTHPEPIRVYKLHGSLN
jgi:hypothetical protein